MNWRDYLKPAEVEELAKIHADKRDGQLRQKRIVDRSRQRAKRSSEK